MPNPVNHLAGSRRSVPELARKYQPDVLIRFPKPLMHMFPEPSSGR
jgi:hypothetical protein